LMRARMSMSRLRLEASTTVIRSFASHFWYQLKALSWSSASMTQTLWPAERISEASAKTVVVFPQPPFEDPTVIMGISSSPYLYDAICNARHRVLRNAICNALPRRNANAQAILQHKLNCNALATARYIRNVRCNALNNRMSPFTTGNIPRIYTLRRLHCSLKFQERLRANLQQLRMGLDTRRPR
jgi:hypothetical protein